MRRWPLGPRRSEESLFEPVIMQNRKERSLSVFNIAQIPILRAYKAWHEGYQRSMYRGIVAERKSDEILFSSGQEVDQA